MSLKCSKQSCSNGELANADQIAFYQDLGNGGWCLGLESEFDVRQSNIPKSIRLIDTGDSKSPYKAICAQCNGSVGKVTRICGFQNETVNFAAKKVRLVRSRYDSVGSSCQKWSNVLDLYPQIRRITATIRMDKPLVGSNTFHFHATTDLQDMINFGNSVDTRSNLTPRRYQWRGYFFACLNNVLLCLPTGMGKTLIANMVMKAYRQRNPEKGQVFIVPTVVLVDQQAKTIEKNTGLKVTRRSGEHKESSWLPQEICVCTHAMLLNAIKMKEIDMSQLSLVVLDEAHEANSALSQYGLLLPYIAKCAPHQRPRVLAMTASPTGSNSTDMRQAITSLCEKLLALPYTPLLDDEENGDEVQNTNCIYIPIHKTAFEIQFEDFVFESLERFAQQHKYFVSNWNQVPLNADTEIKVLGIVKVLSNARLVAQKDSDIRLLQLLQWMSKWVDALNMFQIFGPRKLLEFIIADLEFAQKNDALSEVSTGLMPLLERMRLSINRMQREYTISADSSRVEILLETLRSHSNDQERIIVFVERRNTAERVCRRLRDDPIISKMNPEFIVGNSNGFPKEMQQSILENFHKGKCQVLVATTVLEQGIDVVACGVVICFDGVKSIKSIIQSRGRARKSSSKFLVFVPAGKQQQRVNELTNMEASMNLAIRQLMREKNSGFDEIMSNEIKTFLDAGHDFLPALDDVEDVTEEEDDVDLENLDDRVWFQLNFFNYKDSHALSAHIRSKLKSSNDQIKVTKKCIMVQFAVKDAIDDGSKIIQSVCTTPTGNTMSSLRTWFEVIVPSRQIDAYKAKKCVTIDFDALTGFYFKNQASVSYDFPCIWTQHFKLNIVNNEMVLLCDDHHFSIHPIDVDGPILINDTKNLFEVFLCLRAPPQFFIGSELAPFDFTSRSFNLCLRRNKSIDPVVGWVLRNALHNFSLQVYNICNLKQEKYEDNGPPLREPFARSYLISAWHSKHSALLPPKLPYNILRQLNTCSSIHNLELLLDITIPVRFQPVHVQQIKNFEMPFPHCDPPKEYALFGRVNVTPNRLIVMPMLPIQKNRVLRYFPNSEDFLLVTFTDEHEGNPWRSQLVYMRFFQMLLFGINVGGKQFKFLGCSNSQLREGRCWFSCLDREMVYAKIGEFPNSMNAGRKLTRIALAFSSSIEIVPLNYERYLENVEPDVQIGGVNFSDGIGRVSQPFLKKIKAIMKIHDATVTALQIRVGGIKGVISAYDRQIDDVTFRKSMKKFESDHNILEVLNYNRPIPLYLNRHVILLLSSFDVPDKIFLELQFNELLKCMDALVEDEASLAFVKMRSKIFNWALLPDQIVHEPIFRQMMISNAIDVVSNIVDRARIFVPEGRVLMGVLDETQTLEYGEVYVHIIDDDVDIELEGRVLVFRNPSVLPSDIRILNARKQTVSPRIKQLYRNCLVIPSKGSLSHAQECSGGDLDGDLYYIIWDQNLIPKSLAVPGEKMMEVETEVPTFIRRNSIEDMVQFFCDYVSTNQLGMIANAHLATADRFGMRDQRSIQLARYVTAETDAPKKGFSVGTVDKDLLPDEYPDYMRKIDRNSYRSETILGELYRQAYPILEVLLEKRIMVSPKFHINWKLDVKKVEDFYLRYSYEVMKLLQSLELKSEADLFSGTPVWTNGYMSRYKKQSQLRIVARDIVQAFWRKWENTFEEWRTKIRNDQQLIQEWYYLPKSRSQSIDSFSILALPYVDFVNGVEKSISNSIRDSIRMWVQERIWQWLDEWRKRHDVGIAIMQKLECIEGTESHFYGSSMLGLSEQYSDVDLYASNTNLEDLEKCLRRIDSDATNLKKPHARVSLTYNSFPVEVTNFSDGVKKSYSLAETFDKYRGLWPALRALIEWARNVGIVKSGGSQGLMTLVSFCHLFIYFVTAEVPRMTALQKPYSLKRFRDWIESYDSDCGKYLYDFLKLLSNPKNKRWIVSKTDPVSGEPLIKTGLIDELCKNAQVAIYVLAVHEGGVQKLFNFCAKQRLFKIDKRYMNPATISDDHQTRCLREIEAECNLSKSEGLFLQLLVRNGVFYIEVTGDQKFFANVEKGLNKIHSRMLSVRFSRNRNQAYHMKNATLIIGEFGNGLTTEVSFSFYRNEHFMPQHTGMLKSVLMFRNWEKNLNWRTMEYQRYEKQFISQLQSFNSKQQHPLRGTRIWRFFGKMMCTIRCGSHYLFNIPETLHNTFETITLQQVQINICKNEEALCMENQNNILQEYRKNYNSFSLLQTTTQMVPEKQEPLKLMPLQELKAKTVQTKKECQITNHTQKKSSGVRHSFYPIWNHGLKKVYEYAAENGFAETTPDDQYVNISVIWRQRELVIACDKIGKINEIRHRATRWLSATVKRFDDSNGGDTRTYLETKASLDDDETCLDTVMDYLDNRSVFTAEFLTQIESLENTDQVFAAKPLTPELFRLNWRIRSMRRIVPIRKFINSNNDVLMLNEVYDGIFQLTAGHFEWFPKHQELEMQLGVENQSAQNLCRKSFELNLNLFDAIKQEKNNNVM